MLFRSRRFVSTAVHRAEKDSVLKAFSNINPFTASGKDPAHLYNLVGGKWKVTKEHKWALDPLNGEQFLKMPDTNVEELKEFAENLKAAPKSGLHNPLKNVERYLIYGEVCRKAAEVLNRHEVAEHFAKLIQRVIPKHESQALSEVRVVRAFLANFAGDNVRYLGRSGAQPGDHEGQSPTGYRWPLGGVAVISPFNFPLEIPALQLMGALFMGNKVIMKPDHKTAVVMDEFVRMLHYCGMPRTDCDLIYCGGPTFEKIYGMCPVRMTQFTGSTRVAERLAEVTHGRVRVEDAGFNWKILGSDVCQMNLDYVAYQSDQDAYALSGQKCAAQSLLVAHRNLAKSDLYAKIKAQAARRNLADLSIGPLLSITNKEIEEHRDFVLSLQGTEVLFGGHPLKNHKIPSCFGAWEPTAYYVPLKHFANPSLLPRLTQEIFGPVQLVTEYDDAEMPAVLDLFERLPLHLTAGVVTRDPRFQHKVLAHTVNGTTYAGYRARTTGAPQNHWFGPAGDIRAAGIGTAEAIKLVWSVHREVVYDELDEPKGWKIPRPT